MTTTDGVGSPGTDGWGALVDPGLVAKLANELFLDGSSAAAPEAAPRLASSMIIGAPGPPAATVLPAEPDYYFLRPLRDRASSLPPSPAETIEVAGIRQDFPALHQHVHGKPLVWLDNAATTQKPQVVIDTLSRFYEHDNSNVHRGAHELAARATDAYEGARRKVARFLGASSPEEIVFVRGTTEAINLVAQTYGRQRVGPGDEIVLTTLEHHSNIVPWQMLCQEKGAALKVVPITDRGEVVLDEYERLLGPRVRLVAISHVSNALGTVLPVALMTDLAHRHGACVVVDGAQAVSHLPVDVRGLDCDFYAFSGHKLFGPTGVGVLYGKRKLLEEMPPWQGGGSMIRTVTFDRTSYNDPPYKFEAGTPVIGDAVGLGAAIDYVSRIGLETIARHEQGLTAYAMDGLSSIPGLRPIGTAPGKVAVLSFVVDWMSCEDLGRFLDREGIAVRAGHHCAQPTMQRFGVPSTVRPSLALYNTTGDIDALVRAVRQSKNGTR
jgi:cysteine desulfurase/selenocysteine lyase